MAEKKNTVKKIDEAIELIQTNDFPYAKFPFANFNVVQSSVIPYVDKDSNWCFATSTGSGKTVMCELCLAHELRQNKGKGIYIAPYKALAQEKIDDWKYNKNHHFSDLDISICTGDYILTNDRKEEMDRADIVIMTSEMLCSRVRNQKSEKSRFLKDIGVAVFDEAHLLTDAGRGDHLEVAIMKLTEINPDVRICFLSATMPNVEQIAHWISNINKKDTYLLESSWRPCRLNIHYVRYRYSSYYQEEQEEIISSALDIVRKYKDDKFLIFAHSKATGMEMKTALNRNGIGADFHNAGLKKEKRIELENRFRKDPQFRALVATSTLSTGINAPARRTIILGIKRGPVLVESRHIRQACGRSGRPGFDDEGDAYVLIPDRDPFRHIDRLETIEPIESQLLGYYGENSKKNYKTLAFHLVSEIHHGCIKNRHDMRSWYERSLANFQAQDLSSEILENVIDLLLECGAIKEESGEWRATSIGAISSMFYFSPFDVSDLSRNFGRLFEKKNPDDLETCVALARIDSNKLSIVSRAEKDEIESFRRVLDNKFGYGVIPDPVAKIAFCYHDILTGRNNPVMMGTSIGLRADLPRLIQIIRTVDDMVGKWRRGDWIRDLSLRMEYGVHGDRSHLCRLPHIGAARANKLWDSGLRSFDQIAGDPAKVKSITRLNEDQIKEIVYSANILANI